MEKYQKRKYQSKQKYLYITIVCFFLYCIYLHYKLYSTTNELQLTKNRAELQEQQSTNLLQQAAYKIEQLQSKKSSSSLRSSSSSSIQNNNIITTTLNNFIPGSTTIVLLCYNRPEYLKRTLNSLKSVLENSNAEYLKENLGTINILISQDGEDEKVKEVIEQFILSYFSDFQSNNNNKKKKIVSQIQHKIHERVMLSVEEKRKYSVNSKSIGYFMLR